MRRRPLGLAMLLLGVASVAAAASVQVRTAPVHKQRLTKTVTGYGQVRPDPQAQTTRAATYTAFVERLDVTLGQPVEQGDALMSLSTAPAARAKFSSAKAQLAFARSQLARKRRLRKQQLATNADVASARQALATAKANFAAQKSLGTGQDSRVIEAPFTGIVSQLPVKPGNLVKPGTKLFQLARRRALQVVLGIEPDEIGRIKKGMAVRIIPLFAGGPGVAATVRQIDAVVDPSTRLVNIIVGLSGDQAAGFLQGERVKGRLTLLARTSIAVPRSAVLQDTQGNYVFVVRQSTAHRVNVHTGLEQGGWVGVEGGLKPGQPVVVQGNYELTDGMAVRRAP